MSHAMMKRASGASALGRQQQRAGLFLQQSRRVHVASTAVLESPVAASAPFVDTRPTLKFMDVPAMNKQLEAKAKALIALEESQAANRPMLRLTLKRKIGLGEVWKVVGSCPELGRVVPEVAPAMRWTEGDVWVLETRIREGTHTFKVVLKNADRAYIWETGEDRTLQVSRGLGKDDVLNMELNPKMPF